MNAKSDSASGTPEMQTTTSTSAATAPTYTTAQSRRRATDGTSRAERLAKFRRERQRSDGRATKQTWWAG